MARKRNIKYKKERVLISDVLPYEVPVTFSNQHYYEFILDKHVEFDGRNICWRKEGLALDVVIALLFGIDKEIESYAIETDGSTVDFHRFKDFNSISMMLSIPFNYSIRRQNNRYRELIVCHPKNQLQIINFYHEYKELILYYCNISPFSIRKPSRIARCVIHRDSSFYKALENDRGRIEEHDKEYESFRSFFVYKDFSNIYKFYESFKYHRCEKKYNKLLKIDITKCFDSIYTHSIAWAILGKDSIKAQLYKTKKPIEKSFAGRFDRLMQQLNYNETNGIVIGPEFSRIFSELILQSVDRDLLQKLHQYRKTHKKDYEIYRYVDDYFVFYNDDETKDKILELLQFSLKEFKLYLNPAKEAVYEKPIITEITIAKNKIARIISEKLKYELEDVKEEDGGSEGKVKGSIYIRSTQLITDFKTIIKESGVAYRDILNYTLSVIERKCSKIVKDYVSIEKQENSEKQFAIAILGILEFVFFIYSVSPRVNTTLKLCRILNLFTTYFKATKVGYDFKHIVFKRIYDNICFLLNKNKNSPHTQVETLYLLLILNELGKEYWLDQSMIRGYFKIEKADGNLRFDMELNYFSITVLLFYMQSKKRYDDIRKALEIHILERFKKRSKLLKKDAELTFLLFDTLTCPYISLKTKRDLLSLHDIKDEDIQTSIIQYRKHWFTRWSEFDFGKALDTKRSDEVY